MTVHVIVDAGYGSSGKGAFAHWLAGQQQAKSVVTLNRPNAGHTAIHNGQKFVFCALPTSALVDTVTKVFVGPGAAINIDQFLEEVESLPNRSQKTIIVHPFTSFVTDEDKKAEASLVRIGSTSKGSAESVIRKIRREPDAVVSGNPEVAKRLTDAGIVIAADAHSYTQLILNAAAAGEMIVEGSQGFSLGINNGFYPYCTGRECSTAQVLVDAGIPFSLRDQLNVIGLMRTYPIRVANRFDQDGNMIGTSGPCYPDQREISFEDIGVPTEYTTVTKLPRRVFTFSNYQLLDAVEINGLNQLVITFLDYLKTEEEKERFLAETRVLLVGTGCVLRYVQDGPASIKDLMAVTAV